MIEEWREVPGWPDYAVSNLGQVKRITNSRRGGGKIGRILKPRIPGGGFYPAVALSCDGVITNWYVHRLVAHVFIGPCPDGFEVNHIDGDKENPRLANVEYVTRSENLKHAFRLGLMDHKGEKNGRSRLTAADAYAIKAEYTGKYGQCAALARRFGVSHASIQDIIHGRHWKTQVPA